jgi:hypothetical protein
MHDLLCQMIEVQCSNLRPHFFHLKGCGLLNIPAVIELSFTLKGNHRDQLFFLKVVAFAKMFVVDLATATLPIWMT